MEKGMHGKKPAEECAQTFADAGRFHLQHDTNRRLNVVLKVPSFHLGPCYTAGQEMLGPVSAAAAAPFQLLRLFTLRKRNSEDSTTAKIKN